MSRAWVKLHGDVNTDARLLLCSYRAQALYLRLLPLLDDEGRFAAPPGAGLVEALGASLHAALDDAGETLDEWVRRGLVSAGASALVVSAFAARQGRPTGSGPRGGLTSTERSRMRRERLKATETATATGTVAATGTQRNATPLHATDNATARATGDATDAQRATVAAVASEKTGEHAATATDATDATATEEKRGEETPPPPSGRRAQSVAGEEAPPRGNRVAAVPQPRTEPDPWEPEPLLARLRRESGGRVAARGGPQDTAEFGRFARAREHAKGLSVWTLLGRYLHPEHGGSTLRMPAITVQWLVYGGSGGCANLISQLDQAKAWFAGGCPGPSGEPAPWSQALHAELEAMVRAEKDALRKERNAA